MKSSCHHTHNLHAQRRRGSGAATERSRPTRERHSSPEKPGEDMGRRPSDPRGQFPFCEISQKAKTKTKTLRCPKTEHAGRSELEGIIDPEKAPRWLRFVKDAEKPGKSPLSCCICAFLNHSEKEKTFAGTHSHHLRAHTQKGGVELAPEIRVADPPCETRGPVGHVARPTNE